MNNINCKNCNHQWACCTVFNVPLEEDETDKYICYPLGKKYVLSKRDNHCIYFDSDLKECRIYQDRPRACRQYNCHKDPRIIPLASKNRALKKFPYDNNKKRVSIVISYEIGTSNMLEICVDNILKHTTYSDYQIDIVSRANFRSDISVDIVRILERIKENGIYFCLWPVKGFDEKTSSRIHGKILDETISEINADYILTLDSDCFPVADGWLSGLMDMLKEGNGCAGILHPFSPPSNIEIGKLEYRVRSQQCWNTTHVACQLTPKKLLQELKFNNGDDTGLMIPAYIRDKGFGIDGYKITRCPQAQGDYDEEFNRYISLVFGNKVYHHGGYTREEKFGDNKILEKEFGWARKKVMEEKSAEFLLDDSYSYQFKFDMENEVFQKKMDMLFGLKG